MRASIILPKLLSQGVFLFFWTILYVMKRVCWLVTGTQHRLSQSLKPENYESSAHVQDIWWSYMFDPMLSLGMAEFITTHHRFGSPRLVLAKNMSLYRVTPEYAIYVVVPPEIDLHSLGKLVFLRMTQAAHMKQVIVMPMSSFHRLAMEIGDPRQKLIFTSVTPRSGSTLLCHFFEKTQRCNAYCEPMCLSEMSLYKSRMPKRDFLQLLQSTIRLFCKDSTDKEAIMIKMLTPSVFIATDLHEIYPDCIQLFSYRDPIPTAKSLFLSNHEYPLVAIGFIASTFSNYASKMVVRGLGVDNKDFNYTGKTLLGSLTSLHTLLCSSYLRQVKAGVPIAGVKYEHMVENPEKCTDIILEYCDMQDEHTHRAAISAFNEDSQKGSHLSRNRLSRYKADIPDFTDQTILDINNYCELLSMPKLHEDQTLEGTITS